MKKELIIFIDSGDTLVDESTEIKNEFGTVLEAKLYAGAEEALVKLYDSGFTIALVADGTKTSFDNIYLANGLDYCFSAKAISGELGKEKPSPIMFQYAMEALGLKESDKNRIVMIGNNIKRDILGANRMGIVSILATYSPRYDMNPISEEETPDYILDSPEKLYDLMEQLELQVKSKVSLKRS